MSSSLLWAGLTILVVLGWLRIRSRLAEEAGSSGPEVDDEGVERILREGRLTTHDDEPLDLDEIQEEERRFWEEGWEEPEEW